MFVNQFQTRTTAMTCKSSGLTYTEALLANLKDKAVEIYTGDANKTHMYSDFQIDQKQVVKGILKDGGGDWLMIECLSSTGIKSLVFINSWAIHAVMEDVDGVSFMDLFIDSNLKTIQK